MLCAAHTKILVLQQFFVNKLKNVYWEVELLLIS